MKAKKLYWAAQISGWLSYSALAGVVNQLDGNPFTNVLIVSLISVFCIGIVVSHLLRFILIRLDWLKLSFLKLLPRIIPAVLVGGILFHILYTLTLLATDTMPNNTQVFISVEIQRMLGWSSLLFIWTILYFTYHYFQNFRMQEIKNLRLETTRVQSELNNLKSQLNPHFMFNAMNSIRALIDENPNQAKQSVTQLSNILRSSLMAGKKEKITLAEELELVKDYLGLEKTRYEERLNVSYDIDEKSLECTIPPMLLQTLAENAIKHGISKLPEGGQLKITSQVEGDKLRVDVINSGIFENEKSASTGVGIVNTRKRLELLYGNEATFNIKNINQGHVAAELLLPANK